MEGLEAQRQVVIKEGRGGRANRILDVHPSE